MSLLSTTVTVVGQQWQGMTEHRNWAPRHQDWTSSWLDILCLIHLIRNRVKPVNLNAAIVHVKQIKETREFSTITELLVFQKNNKILEHTAVNDLPVFYLVTFKKKLNIQTEFQANKSCNTSMCIIP